jgi:hypothetical protein
MKNRMPAQFSGTPLAEDAQAPSHRHMHIPQCHSGASNRRRAPRRREKSEMSLGHQEWRALKLTKVQGFHTVTKNIAQSDTSSAHQFARLPFFETFHPPLKKIGFLM